MATETTLGDVGFDYTSVTAWVAGQAACPPDGTTAQHGVCHTMDIGRGEVTGMATAGTVADPHVIKAAPGLERTVGFSGDATGAGRVVCGQGVVEVHDILTEAAAIGQSVASVDGTAAGRTIIARRCKMTNAGGHISVHVVGGSFPGMNFGSSWEAYNCEGIDCGIIMADNFNFVGASTQNITVKHCSSSGGAGGAGVDSVDIRAQELGGTITMNLVLENNISMDAPATDYGYTALGGPVLNLTLDNCMASDASITAEFGGGTDCLESQVTADVYTDVAGGDLSLPSTSPAVNAGKTLVDVTDDILGVARPQGAAYDMGAYEYVSPVVPTSWVPPFVRYSATTSATGYEQTPE